MITIAILLGFRDLVNCDIINPYKIFTWNGGKDDLDSIAEELEEMQDKIDEVMPTLNKKQTMGYIGTVKEALDIYADKLIVSNINQTSKKYYASYSGVFALGHEYDPKNKEFIPKIAMDKKLDNPNDNAYKINVDFSLNMCAEYIRSLELPDGKKLVSTKEKFKEYMNKEVFFVNIIDVWHREDPLIGAVCKVSEKDDWFFWA